MKYTSTVNRGQRDNKVLLLPTKRPARFQPIDTPALYTSDIESEHRPLRQEPPFRAPHESDGNHQLLTQIGRGLKLWFLFLIGFTIACLLAAALGDVQIASTLIANIGFVILRSGIVLLCLLAGTVIFYTIGQSNR